MQLSRIKTLTGIILFFLCFFLSFSQTSEIDSLKEILHNKPTIEKVNTLYVIGNLYEKLNADSSLSFYKRGIKSAEELKNDTLIAKGSYSLGTQYLNSGKYNESINYLYKALKIYETRHSDKNTILCLQYIGIANNEQGLIDNGRNYALKALQLSRAINDKYSVATSLMMIGSTYYAQLNYDEALNYFQQALKGMEEAGDQQGISDALNNVALIYENKRQFKQALVFHFRSLQMAKELGDLNGMAASYHNIGLVYEHMKSYSTAITYVDSCIAISKKTDDKFNIKESYSTLSELYAKMGKFDSAYANHVIYTQLKDTLLNEQIKRQFAEMNTKYETENKDHEISLLNKDKEIQNQVMKRQKIIRNAFIGGFAIVLLFAVVFLTQRNRISKEKKRSDQLLLNILPEETAEELKNTGTTLAKDFGEVTVMFTDFKNFTAMSEKLTAQELVNEINYCYSVFDQIITRHGIEKIKTIGDSYMCAGGLPVKNTSHAIDVVSAALEIRDFMLDEKQKRILSNKNVFEIRIGCNTGAVVAGIVGIKKFAYDIWGDTVNIASRMESSCEANKVNISGSTYNLVKDKFKCEYRGKVAAKNKGEIDMYYVERNV